MVTIYSTPNCIRCVMTCKTFDWAGFTYDVLDLTDPDNAAAREWITGHLGYTQAPVVVINDHDHWSGFRPDQIRRITRAKGA
ncbi:glutaredoxin family protein [Pseudactinotalea sp. Z1748]|uniref:glutaredoxin family protein n=1 Tax=Pseudactinotalea sp. Z1748 TaxID=3413027 RepID=UPI003C79CCF1